MAFVTANGIETHDRVDGRTGALRLVVFTFDSRRQGEAETVFLEM